MRLFLLVILSFLGGPACTGVTETNVVPLPCTRDAECGEGLRCLPSDGASADGGSTGVCETRR